MIVEEKTTLFFGVSCITENLRGKLIELSTVML
jgi:hypothetical protein